MFTRRGGGYSLSFCDEIEVGMSLYSSVTLPAASQPQHAKFIHCKVVSYPDPPRKNRFFRGGSGDETNCKVALGGHWVDSSHEKS